MKEIFLSNDKAERKYSDEAVKSKFLEKENLQEQLSLRKWKKIFTLWFVWEITEEKFWNEFLKFLEIILELDVQILILAKAEKHFQEKLWNLHEKFSDKFLVLPDSEENLRDIYAISDTILCMDIDENVILSALSYISVPVIFNPEKIKIDLLQDFDPLKELWNSFIAHGDNYAFILEATLRAKETFRFGYDWGVVKIHCVNTFRDLQE